VAPAGRPHTVGVIAALQAVGLTVGDAVGALDTTATQKWAVVYGGGVGLLDGTLRDERSDASPVIQVTSVGTTAEQSEWVADTVRRTLLARPVTLAVSHRRVLSISVQASQPTRRDDDVHPPLFYGVDLYRISTTPTV
jgi:hypothetical protein